MSRHDLQPSEWSVGVGVETVDGDLLLRMTSTQAGVLLDTLQALLCDDPDEAE